MEFLRILASSAFIVMIFLLRLIWACCVILAPPRQSLPYILSLLLAFCSIFALSRAILMIEPSFVLYSTPHIILCCLTSPLVTIAIHISLLSTHSFFVKSFVLAQKFCCFGPLISWCVIARLMSRVVGAVVMPAVTCLSCLCTLSLLSACGGMEHVPNSHHLQFYISTFMIFMISLHRPSVVLLWALCDGCVRVSPYETLASFMLPVFSCAADPAIRCTPHDIMFVCTNPPVHRLLCAVIDQLDTSVMIVRLPTLYMSPVAILVLLWPHFPRFTCDFRGRGAVCDFGGWAAAWRVWAGSHPFGIALRAYLDLVAVGALPVGVCTVCGLGDVDTLFES